jgi:hypothetical protein
MKPIAPPTRALELRASVRLSAIDGGTVV